MNTALDWLNQDEEPEETAPASDHKEWLKERRAEIAQYMSMPYEAKVGLAETRIWEWYDTARKNEKNVHVSVGGLDSITLFLLVRRTLGMDIPGVSVSALEDVTIQEVHKQIGVTRIPPGKSMARVINEFGFPVISKAKASKIENLQTRKAEQTFIHAIMTGDMGAQGHFQHSDKIKLPDKYIELFGGLYQEHRPDLKCQIAPFKVSSRCCYWMKELPADRWAEEHNSWPYLGLMIIEGGQRELGLVKNKCNYVGKTTARSCPLSYFTRNDLLQLALDLNVPVPGIYGEIVREPDGSLRTTGAQRTGCMMCGFGIHIEKRPHRFDRLRETNPKAWDYWMRHCVKDPNTGEEYGWGRVLDYIGVGWENDPYTDLVGQYSMFEDGV